MKRRTLEEQRKQILDNAVKLEFPPLAIEAYWDGDSEGWFICIEAAMSGGQQINLGCLRDGGDLRLFNCEVPPWPEAIAANQIGHELARNFEVEFFFPSPEYPEDHCPSWHNREKGYPCKFCGIPLLQPDNCPWRGTCYRCWLKEKIGAREAQWTPEQRMGPRCHICGHPATGEFRERPACSDCIEKFEVYFCANCGQGTTVFKNERHSPYCPICECQQQLETLTHSEKKSILAAMACGRLKGLNVTMKILNCSVIQANRILRALDDSSMLAKEEHSKWIKWTDKLRNLILFVRRR